MDALTTFVLRHRRLVAVCWLVALAAGGFASAILSKHLSQSFEIPGTPSDAADRAIVATYHSGGSEDPLVAVVRLPAGLTARQPAVTAGLRAGLAASSAVGARGGRRSLVVSFASTGSAGFVSADGRTTFGLLFSPTNGNPAQDPDVSQAQVQQTIAAHLPPGSQVAVTGIGPLTTAGGSGSGPGVLDEILIGAVGALAVLTFVFAAFVAVVPLIIAAVSVNTAFLTILGLTYLTSINLVVQFLVGLIGLGVAIDYSLLLITRWREARGRGLGNEEAIRVAMATAGRAIVFSGVTVALGLVALIALPVAFVGAGILLDATVVRSLLVPALVSLFGQWNWWLPRWAAAVLRTSPSPLPRPSPHPAVAEPAMPEGLHPS